MSPVKCLGIGCSPRKNGNTDILVQQAMEGVQAGGGKGELIFLREFNFRPCIGCNGCAKAGECVIQDDMQLIYPKLLETDRIILAAPIFSMGINALAKGFIDRFQRFWSTKYLLEKKIINEENRLSRKGIFLSTAGTDYDNVFQGAETVVKYAFLMLEVDYVGKHLYKKIDAKGEVKDYPQYLQEVFNAGKSLVSL